MSEPEGAATRAIEALSLVLCTCKEREALRLAHEVVSDGLAACVNILPKITSVYFWEGEVCEDRESLLVIKTSDARLDELRAAILELHSYAVPEVLVVPVNPEASSHEYVRWIMASVAGGEVVPIDPA